MVPHETLQVVWSPRPPSRELEAVLGAACTSFRVVEDPAVVSDDETVDVIFVEDAAAVLGERFDHGPPRIAVLEPGADPSAIEGVLASGYFDVLRLPCRDSEVLARALAARRYRLSLSRGQAANRSLHERSRQVEELAMRLRSTRAELERGREDLRQSERLATVGTFAAGIAHQINNPLTGVVGFGELLLLRDDLEPDVLADLTRMVDEAKRAARIIREMLDLTRTCTREEMIDVNALLQRTLHVPQIERTLSGTECRCDFEEPSPMIQGDAFRLQQVFQNLLENAAHALDGQDDPCVVVQTRVVDGTVRIRIGDNGPGVQGDLRKRLFEAFFTTKTTRQRRGTGLGLAVCRSIAREHHGNIHYESAEQVWGEQGVEATTGACFVVVLPELHAETMAAQMRRMSA